MGDEKVQNLEVGVVGSGSMGAGMTLLFAEKGSVVGCFDVNKDAVQKILEQVEKDSDIDNKQVHGYSSLEKLVDGFPKHGGSGGRPRIFVLSLPHGETVDKVTDELLPLLDKGDVVVDGGNEWWESTERRQAQAKERGIQWLGMGVSGGYQAARHGPSMTVGGSKEAFETVKPLLSKWSAKTAEGDSCLEFVGTGGAGHYVKMIHNGIEHAHLSILCEVRGLLHGQLGMSNDEIANTFEGWSKSGPLKGNFLLDIGFKALHFKEGDGIQDKKGIVEDIEDKVTQDADNSEGTGTWSTKEIGERHVAAPAIAAAHQLRIISADKALRLRIVKNLALQQPSKSKVKVDEDLLQDFEMATYGCILGAFVQGLEIITKASEEQGWGVSLHTCLLAWRAGCIIKSDAINECLRDLVRDCGPNKPLNLLEARTELCKCLRETYPSIKRVYTLALETDAVAPTIVASLEWLKAIGNRDLPTNFEEMELDYFGHHNYDRKGELVEGHKKGKYHTEFQAA